MKLLGRTLLIIGLVATAVFTVKAIQQSEHLSVFGVDIAVSSANWAPVFISGAVMLIGILILVFKKN
jgi:hypothetical protein